MSGKPVTRGKILARIRKHGLAISSSDLVWHADEGVYLIDGIYWDDWLRDMTMD